MATTGNLLLGGGEKLTSKAPIKRGGGPKKMPYSRDEVVAALTEPLKEVQSHLAQVPREAKPRGEGVFELTLHPTFLARSHYPSKLLRAVGLRDVGSKERAIVPRKASEPRLEGKVHSTAALYVAGTLAAVQSLADNLANPKAPAYIQKELCEIESIAWISGGSKIRGQLPSGPERILFEIAIHADANEEDIVQAFNKYARLHEAEVDLARRIRVGGLTFMPVTATAAQIAKLSEFTFLRVARPMPALRMAIPDVVRQSLAHKNFALPSVPALEPKERVAIFDGGIGTSDLSKWATEYTWPDTTDTTGPNMMHGSEVTSTFLFGSPKDGLPLPPPYMGVDHYRVLSRTSGRDPDLFDVLLRIRQALDSGKYRYANLSLGPRMPIDDDEVHVWTATLDQLCATHDILTTVAVGNDGSAVNADRIQPPGDMVNALAIGACSSPGKTWNRAPYSCKGPGRSPGFVKPDGVAFGGTEDEPFRVYSPFLNGVAGVQGTSYSAPLVLRAAAGVQALIDTKLDAISLKALLVHHVDPAGKRPRAEVGWGRFRDNPLELLECGPSSATIIFRDTLAKGEYRRCPIPFPDIALSGNAKIKATFCIAAQTDPEHAINYTRSGMGITFRPRAGIGEDESAEFFGIGSQYKAPERELRDAAHKWETILHRDRRFDEIGVLAGPVFDVEYHARAQSRGVAPESAPDVSFALVVTLTVPGVSDLYNRVRQKYQVLQPVKLRTNVRVGT
ncbi:S8 family peptidase [Paraburkholderia tropica]|uniref:S8 family peptidase n=1 Tax=Paraburkholderia tropica TaxID=92647 RepID=UPI002AB6221E|nr:S8 family peptidase [Paraburkholderia tropica]